MSNATETTTTRPTTFGKMEVWDTTTGEACATIFHADADVGTIEKEVDEVGTGLAFEYRASHYRVEFYGYRGLADAEFTVDEYGTARKALAAAKRYAREALS